MSKYCQLYDCWSKYRLTTPYLHWNMDKLHCITGSRHQWEFPTIVKVHDSHFAHLPAVRAKQCDCARVYPRIDNRPGTVWPLPTTPSNTISPAQIVRELTLEFPQEFSASRWPFWMTSSSHQKFIKIIITREIWKKTCLSLWLSPGQIIGSLF